MPLLDADGDGVVTQEELIAALDKDGDGIIDRDEFMYAVSRGVGQGEGGTNNDEFREVSPKAPLWSNDRFDFYTQVKELCAELRAQGDLRRVRELPAEFGTKGTGAATFAEFQAAMDAADKDIYVRDHPPGTFVGIIKC